MLCLLLRRVDAPPLDEEGSHSSRRSDHGNGEEDETEAVDCRIDDERKLFGGDDVAEAGHARFHDGVDVDAGDGVEALGEEGGVDGFGGRDPDAEKDEESEQDVLVRNELKQDSRCAEELCKADDRRAARAISERKEDLSGNEAHPVDHKQSVCALRSVSKASLTCRGHLRNKRVSNSSSQRELIDCNSPIPAPAKS